ncbi:16S rRNA (adenine(1518)-N(6)/adenine(1519)-N(6))-dimethyltransferase RsmA [Thermotoga sp. KOL6]|uniref:16S rRNA (adenine(1518)-N(6)/adenine(1519)-N(6))- dimethyltransferase RsmA n=1 Tax=Thermotoga sp. KOL6 TaxID=126741 RepID=UPI000C7824D6|nr:16S rRNA (adenine(1518)-N(6)/adenine(1519)-N(6))-dimethyltransferase RsmA [Thermotoga sp. KOL6]PLV60168.1 16S rRNA methyltransferase [Thermotoga sp. KOL6]
MKTSYYLKKHNIKLKKHLGQVFLSDDRVARRIVREAKITPEDLVVEIGAGAGTLTEELAKTGARVIAYEIDKTLSPILEERLSKYSNVEIKYENFLEARDIPKGAVCVSNIPYNITGPIIERIIELEFKKGIIMVQKEVGERILAQPGKKVFGYLSVVVQAFYVVRKLFDVSKSHFIPNPEVDSTVIEMTRKQTNLCYSKFRKFVSMIFAKKRKTLKNNLKPFISIFEGVDLSKRAEQLSTEEIIKLYEMWRRGIECSKE